MNHEKIKLKDFEAGKYNPEEQEFFDELAEKYGLEQDPEYLILKKNGKKTFIPKKHKIPTKNGLIGLDDLIQKNYKRKRVIFHNRPCGSVLLPMACGVRRDKILKLQKGMN